MNCSIDCYATKGRFRFQNVKNNLATNYEIYINDPASYFSEVKKTINNGLVSYSYFRWHASGDFIDKEYFEGVIKVANDLPLTSFLAFTKKFELVNEYIQNNGTIPENLHIVFSAWGKALKIKNPHHFPVAYVWFKDVQRNGFIPPDAIECSGNCTSCLQCWNIKSGQAVVFKKH